jgi:hypothetical protein
MLLRSVFSHAELSLLYLFWWIILQPFLFWLFWREGLTFCPGQPGPWYSIWHVPPLLGWQSCSTIFSFFLLRWSFTNLLQGQFWNRYLADFSLACEDRQVPLHHLFAKMGGHCWPWTAILPVSPSQVARIICVRDQCQVQNFPNFLFDCFLMFEFRDLKNYTMHVSLYYIASFFSQPGVIYVWIRVFLCFPSWSWIRELK